MHVRMYKYMHVCAVTCCLSGFRVQEPLFSFFHSKQISLGYLELLCSPALWQQSRRRRRRKGRKGRRRRKLREEENRAVISQGPVGLPGRKQEPQALKSKCLSLTHKYNSILCTDWLCSSAVFVLDVPYTVVWSKCPHNI